MIDKDTIEQLSALARIRLTTAEVDTLTAELDQILDYVSALPEVSGEEESDLDYTAETVFRADTPREPLSVEDRERLLGQFSARQGDYLKLKKFLDNDAV